jgi:hypothetical protein
MILKNKIERIFAFGCSFTEYFWATWPEILAYELDCNFYNYGKSGAGNQFIANMVVQANNYHKFTKNDLVIVSWTNVCREDRWIDKNWITPGNIFTQNTYDEAFVKKWADPLGYIIRDLATIDLTKNLLKSTESTWYMFSMCDIVEKVDQAGDTYVETQNPQILNEVKDLYDDTLNTILPSFMKVLWGNNIYGNKLSHQDKLYDRKFNDGHPNPLDHFQYLQNVLEQEFSNKTKEKVIESNANVDNFIFSECRNRKHEFALYELNSDKLNFLKNQSLIKESLDPKFI